MKKLIMTLILCIVTTLNVNAKPKVSVSIFSAVDKLGTIIDFGSDTVRVEATGYSNPGFAIKKSFKMGNVFFWVGAGESYVEKVTSDYTGNWGIPVFNKKYLHTNIFIETEFTNTKPNAPSIFIRLSHYLADITTEFVEYDSINDKVVDSKVITEKSVINAITIGYKWNF